MSVFAYFKPGENGFYLTDEECKYGKILFDDFVIQGVFI